MRHAEPGRQPSSLARPSIHPTRFSLDAHTLAGVNRWRNAFLQPLRASRPRRRGGPLRSGVDRLPPLRRGALRDHGGAVHRGGRPVGGGPWLRAHRAATPRAAPGGHPRARGRTIGAARATRRAGGRASRREARGAPRGATAGVARLGTPYGTHEAPPGPLGLEGAARGAIGPAGGGRVGGCTAPQAGACSSISAVTCPLQR